MWGGKFFALEIGNNTDSFQLDYAQIEKLEGIVRQLGDDIWRYRGVLSRPHPHKQLLPDYNIETSITYRNGAKAASLDWIIKVL